MQKLRIFITTHKCNIGDNNPILHRLARRTWPICLDYAIIIQPKCKTFFFF